MLCSVCSGLLSDAVSSGLRSDAVSSGLRSDAVNSGLWSDAGGKASVVPDFDPMQRVRPWLVPDFGSM